MDCNNTPYPQLIHWICEEIKRQGQAIEEIRFVIQQIRAELKDI